MSETEPGAPAEGVFDVAAAVWRRRLVVAAVTLAFILGAVAYLHLATYRYTAEMMVVPADVLGGGAAKNSRLNALSSLVGLSLDNDQASPFRLYLEELTSRDAAAAMMAHDEIARTVFARDWDGQAQRWRRPDGGTLAGGVKALLGYPATPWRPPDAARMQDFLVRSIKVDSAPSRATTAIRFDDANPAFAVHLLDVLNAVVDRHMRLTTLTRASGYARFLESKLPTITLAEHRIAIAELLSDQEKLIMLATSNAPYAAEIVERPVASAVPTSPRPLLVLVASAIVGVVVAALGVMAGRSVARWRARRRTLVSDGRRP